MTIAPFVALVVFPAGTQALPAPIPVNEPALRVRVHDYSGVSDATLERGIAEASRIFHEAGIGIEWLICSCAEKDDFAAMDPALRQPPGPNELLIRLMPDAMAQQLGLRTSVLGVAFVPHGWTSGTMAVLMWEQIEYRAGHALPRVRGPMDRGILLGHVMAHEMGHLVLGAGHSASGIMQNPWSSRTFEQAYRGQLLFTPEQARRMHEHLFDRQPLRLEE